MNEEQKTKVEVPKKPEVKTTEVVNIIIPQCCREGWKTCPHVLKRNRPTKRNVGL